MHRWQVEKAQRPGNDWVRQGICAAPEPSSHAHLFPFDPSGVYGQLAAPADELVHDPQPSWLQPGLWVSRHIIPLEITGGRLSYTISRQRRRKARAAAERTNDLADMTV